MDMEIFTVKSEEEVFQYIYIEMVFFFQERQKQPFPPSQALSLIHQSVSLQPHDLTIVVFGFPEV